MSTSEALTRTGLGWQQMPVGFKFETMGRTVQESDSNLFRAVAGFYEPLFMDREYIQTESEFGGPPIPGLLTLSLAEGLVILTGMLSGTGLALLGVTVQVSRPVSVGDTVRVRGCVTESRASSKGAHRGVVTTENEVMTQGECTVMTYEAVRLVQGVK